TLNDLAFPQALNTLTAILVDPSGVVPPTILPVPGGGQLTTTVNLPSGKYRVFAVGQSTAAAPAGLYSVTVTASGAATAAMNEALPIGLVRKLDSVGLAAGQHALSLSDLAFPTALTLSGALVIGPDGLQAARAPGGAPGDVPFTASAATYHVFGL